MREGRLHHLKARKDARQVAPAGTGATSCIPLEDARRIVQDAFERDYLAMLKQTVGHNKTAAAAASGVTRQAIQKLVRKHAVDWRSDEVDTMGAD
jgi:hypothetical protein